MKRFKQLSEGLNVIPMVKDPFQDEAEKPVVAILNNEYRIQ